MDQSNKYRVFLHLAGPNQQAHHKTPAPSVNNAPGHLRQQYQNTRYTKKNEAPIQPPILHQKTNNAFITFHPTNTIF